MKNMFIFLLFPLAAMFSVQAQAEENKYKKSILEDMHKAGITLCDKAILESIDALGNFGNNPFFQVSPFLKQNVSRVDNNIKQATLTAILGKKGDSRVERAIFIEAKNGCYVEYFTSMIQPMSCRESIDLTVWKPTFEPLNLDYARLVAANGASLMIQERNSGDSKACAIKMHIRDNRLR